MYYTLFEGLCKGGLLEPDGFNKMPESLGIFIEIFLFIPVA